MQSNQERRTTGETDNVKQGGTPTGGSGVANTPRECPAPQRLQRLKTALAERLIERGQRLWVVRPRRGLIRKMK